MFPICVWFVLSWSNSSFNEQFAQPALHWSVFRFFMRQSASISIWSGDMSLIMHSVSTNFFISRRKILAWDRIFDLPTFDILSPPVHEDCHFWIFCRNFSFFTTHWNNFAGLNDCKFITWLSHYEFFRSNFCNFNDPCWCKIFEQATSDLAATLN